MAQTLVIISTSGQEFTLPGVNWTADQVVSSFAASVPGLAQMASTIETQGEDKVITFRPRTGTKGAKKAHKARN